MKQAYTLLTALVLILASCSDTTHYAPVQRGTISGHVTVYNEFNEPQPAGKVTVHVLGNGLSLEASTDANGFYTIENVPYGKWTYTISKPGFNIHYKKDFDFREEQATLNFPISRAPSFYVDRAEVYVHQNTAIRADVTLSEAVPVGKEFTLVTYLGNTPQLSEAKYLHRSSNGFTSTGEKNLQLLPSITIETLKSQHGFKSGDTAYLLIYPGAARIYGYWEGETYRVDAGTNSSLAVTFTVTIP
ncbi:MAG TPA: carboxypeptidase-like regulatory domain-containing protein [Pontibacter sp.]